VLPQLLLLTDAVRQKPCRYGRIWGNTREAIPSYIQLETLKRTAALKQTLAAELERRFYHRRLRQHPPPAMNG
jgi:hypothetical protein